MARALRPLSVLLLAGVVVTSACTGGSSDTSTTSTGGGGTGNNNKAAGGKTITYLIGQPEEPQDLVEIKKDMAKFESQNKGLSVKLNVLPNDNLRTVLQTQLQSGSGPDVFGYDTGPGFAGVLAKAGLLYDLGPAYTKYNWKIYPWAKERVTFGGKTVGVPNQVEEVGVYYNKSIFAKYGISQPKNLGELKAAAEKLKSNGITPMTFADKEGWEGGHLLSAPLSSAVGSKGMQALLSGKTPWTSAPVVDAIDLFFSDFNKKGYLPKSPNALTYDNGNALFYAGKAAMNPTGTWLAKAIGQTVKFPVGFMPFPAKNGPGIFVSGLGTGTFVSAKTKNPDGALKLLNYLTTPEHGRWQVETFNNIPAYPVDTKGLKTSPLFAQILADTSKIASGTGDFGYNIDVLSTDKFNKAMWDGLQGVLTGKKTGKQVAGELQQAYTASKSG